MYNIYLILKLYLYISIINFSRYAKIDVLVKKVKLKDLVFINCKIHQVLPIKFILYWY